MRTYPGSYLRHGLPRTARPWASPAHSHQRLLVLAARVRAFLEPVWVEWHRARGGNLPVPLSRFTCGRSSLFLKRVLESDAESWHARPQGHFGFHTGNEWSSHAWVECGDLIIDITADQFGDAPIIVTEAPDPRYHKAVSDFPFREFDHAHHGVINRLQSRWQDYLASLRIDG